MKLFLTKIISQPLIYDVIQHESCIFLNELLRCYLTLCSLAYNLDHFEIKVYYFLHQKGDIIAFNMQNGAEQLRNLCMTWIWNKFLWLSFSSKLNNNEFFIGSNSKLHSSCVWHKFEIWWENRWSKTKRNNENERKWEINWKNRFSTFSLRCSCSSSLFHSAKTEWKRALTCSWAEQRFNCRTTCLWYWLD